MRQRVYAFQHIAVEDLGTFAEVIAARGMRGEYVRLFAGDRVPTDWHQAAALVFLGGPMSVNDEAEYPYLGAEKALIREALQHDTPVLGVCLGAQLIAAAAGARVYQAPRPEIGWAPITLTAEGCRDPICSGLTGLAAVFHWHGETFDLPQGAVRLASSAVVANQAFRLGSRALGLQFHLEVDAAMVDAWMHAYPQDLGNDPDAARRRIAEDTGTHSGSLRRAAAAVFERFLDHG